VYRVMCVLVLAGCGRLGFDPAGTDSLVAVLAIESPPDNAEVGPTAELTGSCTTGIPLELSGTGLASPSSTTCNAGTFAVTMTFTTGFGPKAITIAQGTTSRARTFVRVPRQVTQISAKSASTVSQGFTVNCTLTIERPPNLVDGDLLIGMIYTDGGNTGSIETPGFTRLALDGPVFVAFFKIVSGEPASYDFPIVAGNDGSDTCASGGAIAAFRNADPTNPIDAQSQRVDGAATVVTAPGVTAANPTMLVAVLGSNGPGSGIAKPTVMTIDPDAMPNGSFGISSDGFGNALVAWQEIQPGITGERSGAITTPAAVAGGLVAIRPH
jgi:hypothetical protein